MIPLLIIMPASLQVVLDRELSMVDRITSDTPPLANFQSVHVRYPLLSAAFWKHVLGQLQNLRYLKLSRGYMPDLASVLSLASTIARRIRMVTQIVVQIGYLHLHWRSWSCLASYFRQSGQAAIRIRSPPTYNLPATLFPPAKSLEVGPS